MILSLFLLLLTGIVILLKGLNNKSLNLHLLGIAFILMAISMFLLIFIKIWWLYDLIQTINIILILFFVKNTFNIEKKYPFRYILAICLFLQISLICLVLSIHNFSLIEITPFIRFLTVFLISTPMFIGFMWYSKNAYTSYKNMKEKSVEKWLQMRLKLISISSFVFAFIYFPDYFRLDPSIGVADFNHPISIISFYIMLVINVVFTISQFLAWIMPNWFKNYLNRNNKKDIDNENISKGEKKKKLENYTEDEIMDILKDIF